MDDAAIANLTDAEMAALEACQDGETWNNTCREIKKVRNGQYPPDWWPRVKMSGMMDRIVARWGGSTEFRITPLRF